MKKKNKTKTKEEKIAGEESTTTTNDCNGEGDDGDEVDDEAKGWKLRECGERS